MNSILLVLLVIGCVLAARFVGGLVIGWYSASHRYLPEDLGMKYGISIGFLFAGVLVWLARFFGLIPPL